MYQRYSFTKKSCKKPYQNSCFCSVFIDIWKFDQKWAKFSFRTFFLTISTINLGIYKDRWCQFNTFHQLTRVHRKQNHPSTFVSKSFGFVAGAYVKNKFVSAFWGFFTPQLYSSPTFSSSTSVENCWLHLILTSYI